MYEVTSRHLREQKTLVRRGRVPVTAMSRFLGPTYAAIAAEVGRGQFHFAGPPFGRFRPLDSDLAEFEVEAGFPVEGEGSPTGDIEVSSLPGGEAAVTVHVGPYNAMQPAYQAIEGWIEARGGKAEGDAWEVYLTDTKEQPDPATWRTEIYQPYVV